MANQWWAAGNSPKPPGASEAINAVVNDPSMFQPRPAVPVRAGIGGQMPPMAQPLADDIMAQAAAIGGLTPQGQGYEPPPQMTAGDRIRRTGFGSRPEQTVNQRAAAAMQQTGNYYDAIGKLQGPSPYRSQDTRLAAAEMRGMANAGNDPFAWERGVAYDPHEAMRREWIGSQGGSDPFAWERGVAHDPQIENAKYWEQVRKAQGAMGGGVTQAFRPQAYPTDPMGIITKAAPAVEGALPEAATAGGRIAGAAKGVMGAMGGPAMLAGFGVLNNALDLSDPNSVMRKAIHEGNYGTALARGAVNFVPFGGTIWDNLAGNTHPSQPTVNKPQPQSGHVVMGPAGEDQIQQAYERLNAPSEQRSADPYNHGDYLSRKEAMDLYKTQKTYEDKPSVEAQKNQMRGLSRDLQLALKSGDKKRIESAYTNYNTFERALALGGASYPYIGTGISPVEREWLGDQQGY
jgi:hypothetical protein